MNHLILFALSLFGLILSSCSVLVSAIGTVNDTFNIDVILSKAPSFLNTDKYKFPDNYQLDLSNSSIVCPSNDCKTKIKLLTLGLDEESSTMVSVGDFNLVDDISNGHLSPKKQKLIEQMSIDFGCSFSDIQEDTKNNTTKYICSQPHRNDLGITRNFNSTHYPYRFAASFELPSRHLVLNANEEHEFPRFGYGGHAVFRNETGKIEVK